MIVGFCGSSSGMTQWQKEEFVKRLADLQCSELYLFDTPGSNVEAANLANEVVKIYTIYPCADIRKRAFIFDPERKMRFNRIDTPYINYNGVKVKWKPINTYIASNQEIVNTVPLMLFAPKEHKFSVSSAAWKIISYSWKLKKDQIIIPPIDRG